MAVVLDASVAVAWCLEDEQSPRALSTLNDLRRNQAYVPTLWPVEVANALWMAHRRQRANAKDVRDALELLRTLPIQIAFEFGNLSDMAEILSLAQRLDLSVYDSSYLHLALKLSLPFATLDGQLAKAARTLKIDLAI